eukprot:1237455-Prymnesium_polylepis.2
MNVIIDATLDTEFGALHKQLGSLHISRKDCAVDHLSNRICAQQQKGPLGESEWTDAVVRVPRHTAWHLRAVAPWCPSARISSLAGVAKSG